jgi:osmotically-inducible protein OsmY
MRNPRRPFEQIGRAFSVGMGAPGSERPSPPFAGKGPKGYRRSDDRIREDVCERLSSGYIDASEIEVEVAEGTVTLRGSVPDKRSKRDAEDLIEYVAGIRAIENQLRIASAYDRATEGAEQGERDRERDRSLS